MAATEANRDIEIGHEAGLLSLVELGLGSVLHAFRVPLAGHLLSLNQAFLLSRATLRTRARSAAFRISAVAGLLKSLSPAGKRLTPMLAISAQGALFSTGVAVCGTGVPGVCLGSALLSAWAFVQPLLVSYLVFGQSLFAVAQLLYDKTAELFSFPRADLLTVILALAAAKALLAACVAVAAASLPETLVSRYLSSLESAALRARDRATPRAEDGRTATRAALGDLMRPWFLVPFALNFVYLAASESRHATLVWGLLRPLAAAYLAFVLVRTASFSRAIQWLEARGWVSLGAAARVAQGRRRSEAEQGTTDAARAT
jgi:hypothetical protein